MSEQEFRRGDCVVYQKTKHSSHPGPRAHHVEPDMHGDGYSYVVDKFWRVMEVLEGNRLVIQTRTGKSHVISASDPALRHASTWEQFLKRSRFPKEHSQAS